jgi:hypothetical protein
VSGQPHRQEGHGGPHGQHGHERAAARGLSAATGTITSIGERTFVLTTEAGELTVVAGDDTNFHGLSRREAREAGYEEADVAVINTFAALKVGQEVGVIGERRDKSTLHAKGVHFPVPARFGDRDDSLTSARGISSGGDTLD